MLPKRYAAETKILVGRFVNHDDNLEDEDLTVNLKLTQRLWQEAFGVPYLNPTAAPPVISPQQFRPTHVQLFEDWGLQKHCYSCRPARECLGNVQGILRNVGM
jgi:hypothetical protein